MGKISEIFGWPLVKVLVLSITKVLILASSSSHLPPLIRIPFFVAFPIAEKIAMGVEMTRAQGQEMTRKISACLKLNSKGLPKYVDSKSVNMAIHNTKGV
jgi:hypothetical protein